MRTELERLRSNIIFSSQIRVIFKDIINTFISETSQEGNKKNWRQIKKNLVMLCCMPYKLCIPF